MRRRTTAAAALLAAGLCVAATTAAQAAPMQPTAPARTAAAQMASAGCARADPAAEVPPVPGRPLQIVHRPADWSGDRPVPLVLAFHGAGRTPQDMETYSDLDRADAVVVYPDGNHPAPDGTTARGWPPNDDDPDRQRDLGYVAELVRSVQDTLCIDTARVVATGKSQGGGFTHLLACKGDGRGHPVVSTIAPVAGAFYRPGPVHHGVASCDPTPRSVLEIHGAKDGTIDYRGLDRHGDPGRARAIRTVGADEGWVDEWARRDGCDPAPPATDGPRGSSVYRWSHCRAGTAVVHYEITDGDHDWPGSNGSSGPGDQCVSDVRATGVVLEFLGVRTTAEPRRTCGQAPA